MYTWQGKTRSTQARTQDFEKGGSDYHGEGEYVGGDVPPPHEAQNFTWMI